MANEKTQPLPKPERRKTDESLINERDKTDVSITQAREKTEVATDKHVEKEPLYLRTFVRRSRSTFKFTIPVRPALVH